MSRNLYFDRVLDEMARVHDRKNEDYADDGNPFSNFEGAAAGSGLSVDQVFLCILNIKTERLRQLVSGKAANYESMDDSVLDIANYAAIWLAWRLKQSDGRPSEAVAKQDRVVRVSSYDDTRTPGEITLTPSVEVPADAVILDATITGPHLTVVPDDHHIYPEEEIPDGVVPPRGNRPATAKAWKPDTAGGAILGPTGFGREDDGS